MSKQSEIAELKLQYPTLNRFEAGVEIELTGKDYEDQIEQLWLSNKLVAEKIKIEAEKLAAKEVAQAKLAALGITVKDLQALGL